MDSENGGEAIYDCIVIGAGYAGLAAAKTLKEANKVVLVLEANDRVGGRAKTKRFEDGTYVDCGGSFLGREQPRMYALAKEFGIEPFDAHRSGETLLSYRGKHIAYSGLIPPVKLWEALDTQIFIKRFERMAKKVNLDEPWKTPNAEKLDHVTMADFTTRKCWTKAARESLCVAFEAIWGGRPAEVSLLYGLFYSKAGVDLTCLFTSHNGAQHQYMKGGAQTIADQIRVQIGEDVHLSQPVVKVDQSNSDAVIVTTEKTSYKAHRVISAIPAPQVLKINFHPPLEHPRRTLLGHYSMGAYWLYTACYKTPFWRENGLFGENFSPDEFICLGFDASPKEGHGALKMFVVGAKALKLSGQNQDQRKETILNELVASYGEEARTPFRFVEHTMMDEKYIGGCPVGAPVPGTLTSLGSWLRKPFYKLHWAGTETSTVWNGYMEGAAASGQRAAKEVIDN